MDNIAPNPQGEYIVGVDLGGTNVRAGLLDRDGHVLADARAPALGMEGPPATLGQIIKVIAEAMDQGGAQPRQVAGIGMGIPGRHRSEEGITIFSPNLAGWVNVQVTRPIREHFGLATYMLNDVKTATLGEHRFGAGRGKRHVVMITLGTGIGGGVISDGEIRLGSGEGFSEVGHHIVDLNGPQCTCGSRGCWEAMAGRDAIIRRAVFKLQDGRHSLIGDRTGYDLSQITPALIDQAARDGDAVAREVWEETGTIVGVGLSNLIQLYNPEVVVVGGGIAQAGELILEPARRVVQSRARMVPAETAQIVPAALGEDAGIVGASVLVMLHLEGRPPGRKAT
jgi:glucokinase